MQRPFTCSEPVRQAAHFGTKFVEIGREKPDLRGARPPDPRQSASFSGGSTVHRRPPVGPAPGPLRFFPLKISIERFGLVRQHRGFVLRILVCRLSKSVRGKKSYVGPSRHPRHLASFSGGRKAHVGPPAGPARATGAGLLGRPSGPKLWSSPGISFADRRPRVARARSGPSAGPIRSFQVVHGTASGASKSFTESGRAPGVAFKAVPLREK